MRTIRGPNPPKPPRFPRVSRTLPLKGTGDDKGKWYRCWNCGFICNVDRDDLGGPSSKSGNSHTDYHSQAFGLTDASDILNSVVAMGDPNFYMTAMELGADGEPKKIRHDFKSDVSRGCPLCGSRNYRGDY